MKPTKRLAIQTENGTRYFRVPACELSESKRTAANQDSTGIYVTDSYCSPRGRVIERCYSCWDDGHGAATGTYYRLVEDRERLIREYDGWGLKDEVVDA